MTPIPESEQRHTLWLIAILSSLWLILCPGPARADMETEIEHLLQFIETSACTFYRNGEAHDSREAGAHIRKKYTHTKRWIKSAEDFIQYAATKSSVSGRPYQVICNGVKLPTAQWLTDELARFRGEAS